MGDFDIENVTIIHVIHLFALWQNEIINNSLRKAIPSNDELTCTFINSTDERLEKKLYFYDMWIVHYVLKELSNREETSENGIDELLNRALKNGSMFNYELKEQNIKAVIEEVGQFLDLLK